MSGARPGHQTPLRRLVARALADDLTGFVVPDRRLARAAGLDLGAAGLRPAATARHASVLLLVGPIPEPLAAAAAVAYAQMPRPRAILTAGTPPVAGLPAADVAVALDQAALHAGIAELRRRTAAAAFSSEAAALDLGAVRTRQEYVCPMHPEVVRDEPGSCPICGMDLVAREAAADTAGFGGAAAAPATMEVAPAARTTIADAADQVYTCPMHPEVEQSGPGSCPICGMRLVPRQESGEANQAEAGRDGGYSSEQAATPAPPHGAHAAAPGRTDHGAMGHPEMDHSAMEHGPLDHAAMGQTGTGAGSIANGGADQVGMGHGTMGAAGMGTAPAAMDHAAMGHQMPMDHAAMGHGGMDHALAGDDGIAMDHAAMGHDMGGGFMSMVAMTEGLPRSRDGLPMEWGDVPFGPLFPGLPGGLALTLTLDGDGVARAAVAAGTLARGVAATWPGPVAGFPDRLARLDPLAPVAYRLLAERALDAAMGRSVAPAVAAARVGALEGERVGSHLGWLAEFAALLGDAALADGAAELHLAVVRAGADEAAWSRLAPRVRAFARTAGASPFVASRLAGVGRLEAAERAAGPVARAAGSRADARIGDPVYERLGFAPVVRAGGDALVRLRVRLAEVAVSLDLLGAAEEGEAVVGGGAAPPHDPTGPAPPGDLTGEGQAAVETPRGEARLHLVVERSTVVSAHVEAPSTRLVDLVAAATAEAEVADALVAVASLDISPWELDR